MELSLWMLLSLGVSVLLLLLLLSRATERSSKSRGKRLPPGPTPLPVVGNLFELGDKPHRSLARLAKVYSPIMTLRLGQVNTVFVSSPEMAREILQENDAVLSSRWIPEAVRVLAFNEASMVWLPPYQRWRNLRRICKTELFTTRRLDSYRSLRRQKVQELMQYISDSASKGSLVDVGRLAFSTTLNLISRTIFSVDLADLYGESSQEFKHVVEGILEEAGRANLSDYFPLLAKLDPQGIRHRSNKYFKRLHEIFDEHIVRRLHSKRDGTTARNDFLDELLEHQVQGDGTKFDRQALKCFFSDLFVAGSDTTSSTVEWAMAELLRNPRVMSKVREEIVRVIGFSREVEEADIGSLPYLQAVVKETLRLHPPVPLMLPRLAEATVELHGYEIPEGTRLLINIWAIGRDSSLWTEPEEFFPERFLNKEVDFKGRHFEFIPFGSGRRICPGLPLAYRMVHLMLASMLQRFEWRLPEGKEPRDLDMEEKFGLTLIMASPLKAMAVPTKCC
ncbi:geraniol 8-hydroxylase-like [Musa acuminata AAA Group]|uniref:geraniol 8-hydroxylase-like n=1 Tax=Musa acuminata AAA Group TaxID=214697 RepID=UPI0031D1DFD3